MAALDEDYAEKIFRLTFKRDRTSSPAPLTASAMDKLVDSAIELPENLSSHEPVSIHPNNVAQALRNINRRKNYGGLDEYAERFAQLDKLNPRDLIVERVEDDNDYAKPVTKKMISAMDALIYATVDNKCPDSSVEEDSDDDDYQLEVRLAIEKILALPRERICLDEKVIDALRYQMLTLIVNGEFDILGGEWEDKFSRFIGEQKVLMERRKKKALGLSGGTKRRKSKKKRTRRKLK